MKASKIFSLTITLLAFLFPLFFLPLTTDFYLFNKRLLFVFATGALLLLFLVKSYQEKRLAIKKDSLLFPLAAVVLFFWLSAFIQAPNRVAALIEETGLITSLALFYLLITNLLEEGKEVRWVLTSLLTSTAILCWLTIFSFLGLFKQLNLGPQWLQNKAWSPTGSSLNTVIFLVTLLPLTLFWAFKTKEAMGKILLFIASSLQILATILLVSLFVDKTIPFLYLTPNFGWQICVEGFKNLRIALLGVGPNNFLTAFNQFKPVGINLTSLWATRFSANSNYFFQLLSTVGLLGLVSYLWFVLVNLKKAKGHNLLLNQVLSVGLVTSFVLQLAFSANILSLFVTFLMSGLLAVTEGKEETWQFKGGKFSLLAVLGISTIFVFFAFFRYSRVWLADFYFRKSLLAAQQNKGLETYNLQIKALKLNPFSETYHLNYSSTNFALANSLASQKDLTDQDKSNINQLINQSIREVKTTVALNPQNSDYWANLASLYRNLINIAQDANQWAISSYIQAVRTDPNNPLLRLDFGGLFYGLKDYERAIEQFKIATNLKPDYANGFYNLATAYQELKEWQKAFINLQTAVNLVPDDSPDKTKALSELEELKKKLPTLPPEATPAAQLKEEEKLQKPVLPSPQPGFKNITLPKEVAPETPLPSPSP